MTNLTVVSCDQTAQTFRENIRDIERHIDGDDVTLVKTVQVGHGLNALYPYSQGEATAALVRELRRYANYLEMGSW